MVKRKANREPLQYILGEAHFYKRVFKLNPSVLIPRPETELMVEEVLRRATSLRCLDVGTGSGCIGISLALERPETEVVAIDVSQKALELAQENARELGAKNIAFHQVDFFDDEQVGLLGRSTWSSAIRPTYLLPNWSRSNRRYATMNLIRH